MKDIIALICARGGSKGLPGKNILPLAGKPLIGWAIEHAASVSRINRVIVSTDSEAIAKTAISFGAEVPFIRPADLSRDDSSEWLVWRHALKYLFEERGRLPYALVSVPATAPLRSHMDIGNCLDEYHKGDVDVVITVTDAHRSPYFNMVKIDATNNVSLVNASKKKFSRRQDVPIVYDITTVAYVARPEFVFTHNSIFEGRVRAVKVPKERALDIDTPLDFKIAECLIKQGINEA